MSWLLLFFAGFVIDVFYAFYVRAVVARRAFKAAFASVAMVLPSILGLTAIVGDNMLSIPYLAGLFAGTLFVMRDTL